MGFYRNIEGARLIGTNRRVILRYRSVTGIQAMTSRYSFLELNQIQQLDEQFCCSASVANLSYLSPNRDPIWSYRIFAAVRTGGRGAV